MKIIKPNKYKKLLTAKLQSLLYRLENTGDSDFIRGGESTFLKNVNKLFSDKDFICFDIGANIGDYTGMILENSSMRISAHLFEPQKSCAAILSKRFANAGRGIKVNNFGLSNKEETVVLYKNTDKSSLASIYKRDMNHYNISMDETETIELRTGAEYVKKNNISKVNLMKVDVEGHEMKVFEGFSDFLSPSKVDFIQFEYGGANLDSHSSLLEIHSLLSKKGFILCKMMSDSLEIRPYHPNLENFMYQNWVAVSPQIIETLS